MLAGLFIGAMIVGIFVFQMLSLWWKQNAWRPATSTRQRPRPLNPFDYFRSIRTDVIVIGFTGRSAGLVV